jgi:hypothetical protein
MAPTRKIDLERIERESPETDELLEVLETQRPDEPAEADAVLRKRFTAAGTKMD